MCLVFSFKNDKMKHNNTVNSTSQVKRYVQKFLAYVSESKHILSP